VKNVINDFCYLGGKVLELSGGEPLAYKSLYQAIDLASTLGLEIHLFTCGYIPNETLDIDKLSKVNRFYVNLQGPIKTIHDHLARTPGSFDQAINLIKELKKKGKWVGTHFIPLSINIDEIEEYIELARDLQLDNISLLRFVEQGRGKQNFLSLNFDEISQLFNIIEKYRFCKKLEFKIGCPLDFGFIFKKGRTAISCKSGISRCVVRPNGNVMPCPAFKDTTELIAGNVKEDSLINIWNTSCVFKAFRKINDIKVGGACSSCSFWAICRGRCPAQRLHFYGKLDAGPDPYCPLGH
jgi:radical SAM protein with 4Fe4S-binding SPASM domain